MITNQQKIIGTKRRYVEVSAVPGSGKTHTLIRRVQRLRETVPAEQILVLSFSNASVAELNTRMKMLSDQSNDDCFDNVTVSTTHALALKYANHKSVLSDNQANELMAQAIIEVKKDCRKGVLWASQTDSVIKRRMTQLDELLAATHIKLVLGLLNVKRASRIKALESLTHSQFQPLNAYRIVLIAVFKKYKAIKRNNALTDFGDMLEQSAKQINESVSIPFTHILVDEYQDCSAAQAHLIANLARLEGRSLMVFGDLYQGIYGFAGSAYTPLQKTLEGVHAMTLPLSRRLTAQTAALASAVSGLKGEHAIKTDRKGEMPVLVCDETQSAQTEKIVQHILKLINEGVEANQIAILARTKALLHPAEQLLRGRNIETNRMSLKRNSAHALKVLRLVSLVERCKKDKQKIDAELLKGALPSIKLDDDDRWKKQAAELKKVARTPSLEGRYKQCAKIYLRLLGGVLADAELRADVNRWEPKCRDYQTDKAMRAAIREMRGDKVVTGTIHAAKGREWKHVLVVGATDGLLPIHFAKDEQSIAQERNMMYVAITRAKDSVRLYHAPTNYARGRKTFEKLSQFLDTPAVRKCFRVE